MNQYTVICMVILAFWCPHRKVHDFADGKISLQATGWKPCYRFFSYFSSSWMYHSLVKNVIHVLVCIFENAKLPCMHECTNRMLLTTPAEVRVPLKRYVMGNVRMICRIYCGNCPLFFATKLLLECLKKIQQMTILIVTFDR